VNIWGLLAPKRAKLLKLSTFFPTRANPLPDVGEIRKVHASNRSTKAVNIRCDSVGKLGIYRQKLRLGILPKFSESHSFENTNPIGKKSTEAQNSTDIPYLRAKFGRYQPLHGGMRKKSWEFLFFFVCLSRSAS